MSRDFMLLMDGVLCGVLREAIRRKKICFCLDFSKGVGSYLNQNLLSNFLEGGGRFIQTTALSFTECSGHCGATSYDCWSWRPLATSEGDKVISYTVWREQESQSNSTSVDVTLLMSFCWCHSGDVHCECHFVDITISKLISRFHFIDITLKFHSVDVILLMSLY